METFRLPLREIRKKFTKSEIILMGWRSQEQSQSLKKRLGDKPKSKGRQASTDEKYKRDYSEYIVPDELPDRFYDENGDINLSKVSAADARQFLEAQGLMFPPGISRIVESSGNDDVSQSMRNAYGNKGR
jgi:hypothetical protein